jgi:hypothetical protein
MGVAQKPRRGTANNNCWLMRRRPTNRWTGAAVGRFTSSLVRRRLDGIAPPGQLNRYVANHG